MQFTSSGTDVEPISGLNSIGKLSDELEALARFYRAFNTRDLALMADVWAATDESTVVNPLGGIARGWDEIRLAYERVFNSAARVQVELHDYSLHIVGSMFYALGRERGFLRNGNSQIELHIRATRIFRLDVGRWRQIHYHGSFEDSELLRSSLSAIRASA